MKITITHKIICLVVAFTFLVQDICFGLGVMPGSTQPSTKADMYAAGQKLFAAKRGPGAIDWEKYTSAEFIGQTPQLPGGLKFIKAGPDSLPPGLDRSSFFSNLDRMRNPSWGKVSLVKAFQYFRDEEAKIPADKLEIREGYFDIDEANGELGISRIEQHGDRHVLIVHRDFIKRWNHILENDIWFEYTFPDGQKRQVSVAWAIFFRVAKHEMGDLSKKGLSPKGNISHITFYPDLGDSGNVTVSSSEFDANSIWGRFNFINDAIWMWFLGSYCFTNSTRYNNDILKDRLNWFLESKEALRLKLDIEFPNLLQRSYKKRQEAIDLALIMNYQFFGEKKVGPATKEPGEAEHLDRLKREAKEREKTLTKVYPATGNEPEGSSVETQIESIIQKRLPEEFHDRFGIPNYPLQVHREGPVLKDHLQAMLKVLNNPASYPEIPERYRKILMDTANRDFFEEFILNHDLGKTGIAPITIREEGRELMLYPKHEEKSTNMVQSDPRLARNLVDRNILIEAVKLHGALYFVENVAKGTPDQSAFRKFVEKIDPNVDARKVLELLIAADFLDTIATERDDPWQPRVQNFAKAFEEWEAKQSGAATGKAPVQVPSTMAAPEGESHADEPPAGQAGINPFRSVFEASVRSKVKSLSASYETEKAASLVSFVTKAYLDENSPQRVDVDKLREKFSRELKLSRIVDMQRASKTLEDIFGSCRGPEGSIVDGLIEMMYREEWVRVIYQGEEDYIPVPLESVRLEDPFRSVFEASVQFEVMFLRDSFGSNKDGKLVSIVATAYLDENSPQGVDIDKVRGNILKELKGSSVQDIGRAVIALEDIFGRPTRPKGSIVNGLFTIMNLAAKGEDYAAVQLASARSEDPFRSVFEARVQSMVASLFYECKKADSLVSFVTKAYLDENSPQGVDIDKVRGNILKELKGSSVRDIGRAVGTLREIFRSRMGPKGSIVNGLFTMMHLAASGEDYGAVQLVSARSEDPFRSVFEARVQSKVMSLSASSESKKAGPLVSIIATAYLDENSPQGVNVGEVREKFSKELKGSSVRDIGRAVKALEDIFGSRTGPEGSIVNGLFTMMHLAASGEDYAAVPPEAVKNPETWRNWMKDNTVLEIKWKHHRSGEEGQAKDTVKKVTPEGNVVFLSGQEYGVYIDDVVSVRPVSSEVTPKGEKSDGAVCEMGAKELAQQSSGQKSIHIDQMAVNKDGDGREPLVKVFKFLGPHLFGADMFFTQVIHNFVLKAFDFKKASNAKLDVGLDYFPQDKDHGILKMSILQPALTDEEWAEIVESGKDFEERGPAYLMEKYEKYGTDLISRDSHFLYKFANIINYRRTYLRYERLPATSQTRVELYIELSKDEIANVPSGGTLTAPKAEKGDYINQLDPAARLYIEDISKEFGGTEDVMNALAGVRLGKVSVEELAKILKKDIGVADAIARMAQAPLMMAAPEATQPIKDNAPSDKSLLSRRKFLALTMAGLAGRALIGSKGMAEEKQAPPQAASEVDVKKAFSWIKSQINKKTGLVESFEGLPKDDPSSDVCWMYNQAQAMEAALAMGDQKTAEELAKAALKLPRDGKVWYNAYVTESGTVAGKLPEQNSGWVGPNMALGHAFLNILERTKDKDLAEKLVNASIDVAGWLDSLLQEKGEKAYVRAGDTLYKATTEHNLRAMAFYYQFYNQLNDTKHPYRELMADAGKRIGDIERLKKNADKIIRWIKTDMWDKDHYRAGYVDHRTKEFIPAIFENLPSGHPEYWRRDAWIYPQYLAPIMAHIAGLDTKEFAGGLDWLLKHKSRFTIDGNEYKGIARWPNTDSLWGKGTSEAYVSLKLMGKEKEAAELLHTLRVLQAENGGIKAAVGDTKHGWPINFPYPSVEATSPVIIASGGFSPLFIAEESGSSQPIPAATSVSPQKVPAKDAAAISIITIISTYALCLGLTKGPGSEKLSETELENTYKSVGLLHNSQIEIFLPQALKLTEAMKKTISDIKRREGQEVLKCREYTGKEHLEQMLRQKPADGVKRIVISESSVRDQISELVTDNAAVFQCVRLLNVALPASYDEMDPSDKSVCQAGLIQRAIIARLFEKGKTPFVEMLLREILTGHLDEETTVDEFIGNLAESDDEAGDPGKTLQRIKYFLGKTVSLIEKLGKQLQLMKEFWTAA